MRQITWLKCWSVELTKEVPWADALWWGTTFLWILGYLLQENHRFSMPQEHKSKPIVEKPSAPGIKITCESEKGGKFVGSCVYLVPRHFQCLGPELLIQELQTKMFPVCSLFFLKGGPTTTMFFSNSSFKGTSPLSQGWQGSKLFTFEYTSSLRNLPGHWLVSFTWEIVWPLWTSRMLTCMFSLF